MYQLLVIKFLNSYGVEFEVTSTRTHETSSENVQKLPNTIEEFEEQEAKEAEQLGQVGAGIVVRKTPEYIMNYQQSVSAEDVFLQVGACT